MSRAPRTWSGEAAAEGRIVNFAFDWAGLQLAECGRCLPFQNFTDVRAVNLCLHVSSDAGLRTGASPGPALAHSTSLLSGQAAAAAVGSVGASSSGGAPPAFQLTFSGRPLKTLKGHTRNVTGLDVLPSSGNLVSCSLDGQLLVWDYVSGTVLHRCGRACGSGARRVLRHGRASRIKL